MNKRLIGIWRKLKKSAFIKYFFRGYRLRNFLWIVLISASFSLIYIYEKPAFLFEWQTLLTDRLLQKREPTDQITIIGIDDKSLSEIGAWPWDRNKYAELIKIIDAENPRVIAFDIIFAEDRKGDKEFLKELKSIDTELVFASKLSEGSEIIPNKTFADHVSYGFVNFPCDRDGKVRNVYVMQELGGKCLASLSFEILSKYFGNVKEMDCEMGQVKLGFTKIKVENGIMKINYTGSAGSFNTLSFSDILKGNYPEDVFTDKIVLVGSTAEDISDNLINPLDGNMISGIEIQANVINTVMKKEILYPISLKVQISILLLILLGNFFISSQLRIRDSFILTLTLIVSYSFFALFAYEAGWVIDVLFVPLAIFLSWVTMLLAKYAEEKQDTTKLKQAFIHYVNPKIMNKILADPRTLKLGGEKRRMTTLFSDIRKFTGLSEIMQPEELVLLMNKYFNTIANEVLKNNGTIDKFAGDDVMSFWNAPIHDPQHAYNACKTAVQIKEKMKIFNQKFISVNKFPKIEIGIGINTGDMIVGNIGSEDRFDYTILGDQVNIASRLEGLTKEYKVCILVAGGTVKELKRIKKADKFSLCKIDRVKVKGRENVVEIFNILGLKSSKLEQMKTDYERAFNYYQKRKFRKAAMMFKRIYKKYNYYPGLLLSRRSRYFVRSPRGQNWDGSWIWYKK